MPKRTRATLRSRWWKSYFSSLRYCYSCGRRLSRRYIREEGSWRHQCSSCSTITYLNPKLVAGLIPVLPGGKIVLLKRSIEPAKGAWSYPAGFQELGETIEEAAKRETFEEIKARVKPVKLVGIYSYPDAGVVTLVFTGRVLPGFKPQPTPEAEEVKIFHKSQIPWRHLAFRSTIDALKDWKKA